MSWTRKEDECMECFLATTTWNSADHIGIYLRHYRALGFRRAFVMDFDSTDGTREILTAGAYADFVTLIPFPGIAGLDSSNIILEHAKAHLAPGTWCLFCDPDELLVTPSMHCRDLAPERGAAIPDVITVPRFNTTAARSIARDSNSRVSALDALTLRVTGRVARAVEQDLLRETLEPSWIFTAIPGKVLVRAEVTDSIGDGDHVARASNGQPPASVPAGTYLMHYPFRGYDAFRRKIEMARLFYSSNPQFAAHHGWQLKRWMRLAEAGELHREYLDQFVADEKVQELVGGGALVRDESVVRFHLGPNT
jgi:hypothetical protein